jgi:hypothetical protein
VKKIIFFFLLISFTFKVFCEESSVLCTDFIGKTKNVKACGVAELNFDNLLKDIIKKYGTGFSQLRLVGWDDKASEAFLAVSKNTLIENICYVNLDKILKFNLNSKKLELIWDSQQEMLDVLDNINTMTVLKHSMVSDNSESHNCDPLMFVNKVHRIGKNLGNKYNSLLNEDNFLVVPGIGHPSVFFFSPNFKKLMGSFFIADKQTILKDAIVSERGTLLAIVRDMAQQKTCVAEYDLESGEPIRKKCSPAKFELTYLIFGQEPYLFIREFQKGETIVSLKNWFLNLNYAYVFKPKAYFPIYFFPTMKIQKE